MSFPVNKVDSIFEEPLNLHVTLGQLCFPLPLRIPEDNKDKTEETI